MLASVWTVFRLPSFEPIARRALWLAVAALVGGVAALFMELGYPLPAMLLIPFSFSTQAPLFWKVWGVIVYTVALAVLILTWLAGSRSAQPLRGVAIVALVAAVHITFMAGAVYGWMSMRPFWFGGEMSLAFMVEALLGAVTFVIIFTHLAHGFKVQRFDSRTRELFSGPLAALFAVLMIAHAFFVVSRLIAGLWSNAVRPMAMTMDWPWPPSTPGHLCRGGSRICRPPANRPLPACRQQGSLQFWLASWVPQRSVCRP